MGIYYCMHAHALWLSFIAYPCALGNGVPNRCMERARRLCVEHMWMPCGRSRKLCTYTDKQYVWKAEPRWRGAGQRGLRMLREIKTQTSVVFFFWLIIQSFNKFLYESHVQLFIFFYCFDGCCCCWDSRFPLFVLSFLFFSNCYKLTWF